MSRPQPENATQLLRWMNQRLIRQEQRFQPALAATLAWPVLAVQSRADIPENRTLGNVYVGAKDYTVWQERTDGLTEQGRGADRLRDALDWRP